MAKTLLIIQHEEDTPAGSTLEWAASRGYEVLFFSPALEKRPALELDQIAGVVICGGGMDVFEEEKYPWLVLEKQFISEILAQRIKVFGLCLGAQLLAEILGGRVYRHEGWEIGFITGKSQSGESIPMFHWHHCVFELPPEAELWIQGDYWRNQAFLWKDQVMATQFHPEATEEWIRECAECIDERGQQKYQGNVQTRSEILQSLTLQKKLQTWYFQQLDRLFQAQELHRG